MKELMTGFGLNAKTYWKLHLSKIIYLILGVIIFTIGISLYIPLAVGASQVDFSIFAIIFAIWKPKDQNGLGLEIGNHYGDIGGVLFCYYVGLFIFTFIFGLVYTIKEFRKSKEKRVWIPLFWILISDLIVTILVPMLINVWNDLFEPYSKWISELTNDPNRTGFKSIIFMGVYLLYIVGIALWAHSTWFTGPYNSICTSFMNMTGWNYKNSRMLMDFMMFVPGILTLLIASNSWADKATYLSNNLNFGTFIFIILTGPSVGILLGIINKKFNWDIWKNQIDNKLPIFKKINKN